MQIELISGISLSLTVILMLLVVAFLAGFVDSIAGGGGLISLPVMLLTGLPPHLVLGTNKLMSTCGTSVALFLYAKNGRVNWHVVSRGLLFSLIGSAVGAYLVMRVNPDFLGKVLVVLLPIAAVLCLGPFGKRFKKSNFSGNLFLGSALICSFAGLYDGFFGPGTGVILVIVLHAFLGLELVEASGTTKAFNLASNVGALVTFCISGQVLLLLGLPMAVANIAGNFVGSRLAIKNGAGIVRKMMFVSVSLLVLTLAYQYFLK